MLAFETIMSHLPQNTNPKHSWKMGHLDVYNPFDLIGIFKENIYRFVAEIHASVSINVAVYIYFLNPVCIYKFFYYCMIGFFLVFASFATAVHRAL